MSLYRAVTFRSSSGGRLARIATKRLSPQLPSQALDLPTTHYRFASTIARSSNNGTLSRGIHYYVNAWNTKVRDTNAGAPLNSASYVYCRSHSSKTTRRRQRRNVRQREARVQQRRKTTKAENKIPRGPHGRPAMTENSASENDILQNNLRVGNMKHHENNPKVLLHQTKAKVDMEFQIKHRTIPGNNGEQALFVASMTTTLNNDGFLSLSYHPHVSKDFIKVSNSVFHDSYEFVTMGVATTKKRAEMLAAADAAVILYEMGLNCCDPPNIQDMRRQAKAETEKQRIEQEKAAFKADLAKAQMILEIIDCSRPKFETNIEGMVNGRHSWVSTASCFVWGIPVSAKGGGAPTKAEAEGKALIAISNSSEMKTIVGGDLMTTYHDLIEASPGQHVASLKIPPLSDDLLQNLLDFGGSAADHDIRVQSFRAMKDEYESKRRNSQTEHIYSRKSVKKNISPEEKQSINIGFAKQEQRRQIRAEKNPDGKEAKMKAIRDALPIKKIQHDLIEALRKDQVVVVSGGTGSGKSTQCPQYILEDAIANGQGADTKILVTQPRKIAAVSVAERVAAERCERIGKSVGYTVRFQRRKPRDHGGSIEFVTTGILLRRLINEPTLPGIRVIMIDEVHERDINTDFLLVLLRDLLKVRTDLRVVLMSATLDAESFSDYFSSATDKASNKFAPLLSVPTQPRHPVEVFYLEDLIDDGLMDSAARSLAEMLLLHNNEQLAEDYEEALEEEGAAEELRVLSRTEDEGWNLGSDSDDEDSEEEDSDEEDSEQSPSSRIEMLRKAISLRKTEGLQLKPSDTIKSEKFNPLKACVKLITDVSTHLCKEELAAGRSGSILCFLPGWDEIKAAMEELESVSPELLDNMTVLPLHSTIPHEDQQKVFQPAEGKIKLILATNIAESSVTIDDVLAVVDSGLVRELNYDAERAMNAMETNRTSRASSTQRLGRAGRVAPGKCYRLFSRADFEAMPPRPTPEMKRTALEATCLQTCSMTHDSVEQFLSNALDPPTADSVSYAMDRLIKLEAIEVSNDGEQSLSPLGRCLSGLPLDPATGRMLIMGVVMKCLDPLLTAAACFSSRNVFYNPPGLRDEAKEIRQSFSEQSDIMAMTRAYNEFWSIVDESGWPEAKEWAQERYVSIAAMSAIKAVRSQLIEELHKANLVADRDLEGRRRSKSLCFDALVNRNADNEVLYTAIWATAFPGNLAARRPLASFGTLRTRVEDHAGLHPSSVAFHRKPPGDRRVLPRWYLYQEMVLSSQVFLRSVTGLEPEQILLFGGYRLDNIASETAKKSRVRGVLDNWIVVEGQCKDTVDVLSRTRQDINLALQQKVMFPLQPLPAETQSILDVACNTLDPSPLEDTEDGVPGALNVDWWSE